MEKPVGLLEIQKKIQEKHSPAAYSQYFELIRHWMSGRITLEVFDKQAQRLIALDLHTKFLISIINLFETNKSIKKSEPIFQVFYPRTAAGWLPDKTMIKGWAILTAVEHDLEGIEENILQDIFFQIKNMLQNLLEAVLRMSRSYVCSDTGFVHSFGSKNLSINIPNTPQKKVRCILPSSNSISANDILDCIDLNPDLIPHLTLQNRLLKRLENISIVRKVDNRNNEIKKKMKE